MYNKLTFIISLDNLECRCHFSYIRSRGGGTRGRDTSIHFVKSEKISYPTQIYKNIRHAQHTTDKF